MKKLIVILLCLYAFTASAQPLQYNKTYGFQFRRVVADTLMGAPSDTFSVPTIYKNVKWFAFKDNVLYSWNTTDYYWQATSGGSGTPNANAGAGFRLLKPADQGIKTLFAGLYMSADSTTNTNGVTVKVDTASMFPQIRSTIPAGGGGIADNIYTADGILEGNRLLTGREGAYGLQFDSLGYFRVNRYAEDGNPMTLDMAYDSPGLMRFTGVNSLGTEHGVIINTGTPGAASLQAGGTSFTALIDSLQLSVGGSVKAVVADSFRIRQNVRLDGAMKLKKGTASRWLGVQDENGRDAIQHSWNTAAKIYFQYLYDTLGAFHWNMFNEARTSTWIVFGVKRYLTRVSDTAYFGLGNYPGDPSTYEPLQEGYMWMNDATANFRGYRNGLSRSFVMNNTGYGVDTVYMNGTADSLVAEIFGRRYAFKMGGSVSPGANGTTYVTDNGVATWDVTKGTTKNSFYYFNDFFNPVATQNDGNGLIANNSSGTTTNSQMTADNHPGEISMATGTGATNAARIQASTTSFTFGGGATSYEIGVTSTAAVSDGTNSYQILAGFLDAATVNQTDGAYFLYDTQGVSTGSASSANWQIVTVNNGTRTFTTTSTPYAINTYNKLRIEVNAAGTSVDFYIDGSLVGTHTTNIPTGTSRSFGFGASIIKSAGTTARNMIVDYLEVKQLFTTPR